MLPSTPYLVLCEHCDFLLIAQSCPLAFGMNYLWCKEQVALGCIYFPFMHFMFALKMLVKEITSGPIIFSCLTFHVQDIEECYSDCLLIIFLLR